jgi:hypothetical protein
MLGLTLKSKLIEAGIIKEYEDNCFWFTKTFCIVFWISTLVGGPIVSLLSIFISKTTGFFNTFLTILYFSIAIWQTISFIIFLVNFIKWKNIFGPWDF